MAKITPMAPDSAGFKVLVRLYHLGGRASVPDLMETLWTEFRSAPRFEQIVTRPLVERGLVRKVIRQKVERLAITNEGSLMVRQYQASLPVQRTPAATAGMLDANKHLRWGNTRPGALDYREIPSLMGGERVPFRRTKEETTA